VIRRAVFELAHKLRVERGDHAIGQEHLRAAIERLQPAPVSSSAPLRDEAIA
jgi:hypothetical protein